MLYSIKPSKLKYLAADILLVLVSGVTALALFRRALVPMRPGAELVFLLLVGLSFAAGVYLSQGYRIIWRYSTVRDFYRLLQGCVIGLTVASLVMFFAGIPVPRQAVLVTFILATALLVLYRVILRDVVYRREGRAASVSYGSDRKPGKRVLIAGAGEAGRIIISEFERQGMGKTIIGLVDDDRRKVGTLLGGKPVLGTTAEMTMLVEQYGINEVIIAMPSAPQPVQRRLITDARRHNPMLPVTILPPIMKTFEVALTPELRSIGIDELLGRDQVPVDLDAIAHHYHGRHILVTGAGGSIGRELCRQVLKFEPASLTAVGRGEFSMYNLKKDLGDYMKYMPTDTKIRYHIGDVMDRVRMKAIMEETRPAIVFHAAAHKYVDLMEENPTEAFRNNVLGTRTVLLCAEEAGVEELVLVSTDKAVRPVSVMGATKRVAEMLAGSWNGKGGMRTAVVRFGNVIGSRGSVIPLFQEQIERGGPVTVTHPEMTRYFMSIPEAVLLILNASAYAAGADVFVLDMGEQYKIDEVARNLVRLYGFEPDRDIRIQYTGIRPGEKLYEELWYENESMESTGNERIFRLNHENNAREEEAVGRVLHIRAEEVQAMTPDELKVLLKELVPEYRAFGGM